MKETTATYSFEFCNHYNERSNHLTTNEWHYCETFQNKFSTSLRRHIWWKLHDGDWAGHAVGDVVADATHKCPAKRRSNGVD